LPTDAAAEGKACRNRDVSMLSLSRANYRTEDESIQQHCKDTYKDRYQFYATAGALMSEML